MHKTKSKMLAKSQTAKLALNYKLENVGSYR